MLLAFLRSHILDRTTMRVCLIPLLLGLSLCGCATLQDYQYNLVQRCRADSAYKENYGLWSHCSHDYQDGWKQGYYDLSTGQCEELPATPPHKYWHAKYQSQDGRAAIEDWYSGWQDGATAAVQHGRPYFHPIVASPTAPVNQYNAHNFHCGPGGDELLEGMPPTPPTHEPQPQVHVGPAPQEFSSLSIDDGELLDESALPVSYPVEDDDYFDAEADSDAEDMDGYE
jgi:hypothetical protein